MIDELLHSHHKERPQQLSSFLPLILVTSILVGAVSGAVGGALGSRYFGSAPPVEEIGQPKLKEILDAFCAAKKL